MKVCVVLAVFSVLIFALIEKVSYLEKDMQRQLDLIGKLSDNQIRFVKLLVKE